MPPKAAVMALPAVPPLYSLLTASPPVNENETRWEAGFAYEPESCGQSSMGILDPCSGDEKPVAGGSGAVSVEPFTIFAGDACSSYGFASRDWKGRAARKLAACESKLIESELWRGDLARASVWDNKYLASNDATIVTSSPATPLEALACLEQSLADCNCGGQGMIHATPQVITHWANEGRIRSEGGRLLTILGTIIVPGSGYDGSGPAATPGGPPVAPSGSVWAYATGMVAIRLGPVTVIPDATSEAMDRATNFITVRAERVAAASWDCCQMAAEIALTSCETGS